MDSVLITLPRQLRIERDLMQARVTWPLSRGRGYIVLSPGKRLALDIMYGNSFMYGYRYRQYTDSAQCYQYPLHQVGLEDYAHRMLVHEHCAQRHWRCNASQLRTDRC